jgi:hypothetical protein
MKLYIMHRNALNYVIKLHFFLASPHRWKQFKKSKRLVKRPEREAVLSPPSNDQVKNEWQYTSTPQNVFMAWCLVKQEMCLHGVILS